MNYNPNIDSDSDTETDTKSESSYESTDSKIQHVDALQKWANFLQNRATEEGFVSPAPAATNEVGVGLFNTALKFEQKRQVHVVMVDSLNRDQLAYPLPTDVRLKLPRIYKNVERIDIVQLKFFCGLYTVSLARKTNTIWVSDVSGEHPVVVPDGSYSLLNLLAALAAALNATSSLKYTVTYNQITGRVTIAANGVFSLLFYSKANPLSNQTAYLEWGLGWMLGWGGQPVDQTGKSSYTADHFPRIFDDYIYLQLNDTERMNDVDHTYLEDTAKAQDSTGQVSHYFGKLLMNNFGCYAQTFVEAPKFFAPVLGRLDRLNFTWVDRNGNPLTGTDAASCDWHMALRITEIVEVPAASSTLILAPPK